MSAPDYANVLRANLDKLEACGGPHRFVTFSRAEAYCEKCGGKVGLDAMRWYERGVEHGRKIKGGKRSPERKDGAT